MKKLLPLAIVLTGILFPFGWLARFSATYAAAFDQAFATQFSHVLTHAALFAGLALCVMELLSGKPKHRAPIIALIVLACAAFGQEAIQVISRGALPVADTLFDLGVDMLSGGAAVMTVRHLSARYHMRPITRQGRESGDVL